MSYTDEVRKAKSAQEAMLTLAGGIDQILTILVSNAQQPSGWDAWEPDGAIAEAQAEIIQGGNHSTLWDQVDDRSPIVNESEPGGDVEITFMPVDDERKEKRRQFERQSLKLSETLGDPVTDYNDAYAKGGPLWLYHGNRELLMTYPHHARQMMAQDILETAGPEQAQLFSIDVLKEPCADGPGSVGMGVDEHASVNPRDRIYTS